MNNPPALHWCSPLSSCFDDKAQWQPCGDATIVESTGAADESAMLEQAGFCDLSALPRLGAKGDCAKSAPPINTTALLDDGTMCCRLGADEVLLLAAADGSAPVLNSIMPTPRLLLPRRDSHCQIGLAGTRAKEVLARLCAVPPPASPALLQTRAAHLSVVIVAEPRGTKDAFYLLADSGYAGALWEEITAAAIPLGGGACGWQPWRALLNQK